MATIGLVQEKTAGVDTASSTTDRTVTFDSSVTAGNLVVVRYCTSGINPTIIQITDNKGGNTWTKYTADESGGAGYGAGIAYARIVNGGSSFQVTIDKDGGNCVVGGVVTEYSDVHADIIDGTPQSAHGISTGPAEVSLVATTYEFNLVVGSLATPPTSYVTNTPKSGYTADTGANGVGTLQLSTLHRDLTATGTYTPGWTVSIITQWAIVALALKGYTTAPAIESVSDTTPANGSTLTITGVNLKAAGNSTCTLGGISQTVTTQSATVPQITVARGTNKYGAAVNLIVTDSNAVASNTYTGITGITPQSGWAYVNIGTPDTTSAYRVTAVGDIVSGDQLAYDTAGGLVVLFADGTFSADPSITSFDVECWSSTGGGWGAVGTQTISSPGGSSSVVGILSIF